MDRRTVLLSAAGAGALALGGAVVIGRQGTAPPVDATLLPVGAEGTSSVVDDMVASHVPEMVLGAEDAPVTLIEYASFTCPHCRSFHERVLPELKANYIDTGRVRYVYREVYFDRPGLWAAMVARCGGEDRYFGIVDLIYENQQEWTQGAPRDISESLMRIGRTAGLSNEELDACLTDAEMAQAMIDTYEANRQMHDIPGTPSLVINDTLHGNMSYADLAALLDDALAEAE